MSHQSNNKPHYLQESDTVGRGDGGERVLLAWQVQSQQVLEEMENLGVSFEDVQKALANIRGDLQRPGGTKIFAALRIFVDWLITGKATAEDVGKGVFAVAYLLQTPHAPASLDQLGVFLGVKKTQAFNVKSQVNGQLADFLRNLIKKPSGSEQSAQY